MKDREGVASLSLSSRSWLPATDPQTDQLRPLCRKHLPRFLTRAQKSAGTRSTIYRCLVCGACYEVVEVVS